MALTDTAVRNAKPKAKPYKLTDGDGLFVLVHPNGSRYWRFKYNFLGKERTIRQTKCLMGRVAALAPTI